MRSATPRPFQTKRTGRHCFSRFSSRCKAYVIDRLLRPQPICTHVDARGRTKWTGFLRLSLTTLSVRFNIDRKIGAQRSLRTDWEVGNIGKFPSRSTQPPEKERAQSAPIPSLLRKHRTTRECQCRNFTRINAITGRNYTISPSSPKPPPPPHPFAKMPPQRGRPPGMLHGSSLLGRILRFRPLRSTRYTACCVTLRTDNPHRRCRL